MQQLMAISVFCEDIREEKKGTDTLVGIYPDNVNVPKIPCAFPRLALYTRVHLNPSYNPGEMSLFLRMPDGYEAKLTTFPKELVEKATADANTASGPIAGLVSRAVAGSLRVQQAGRIVAILRSATDEYIIGSLNVQQTPKG